MRDEKEVNIYLENMVELEVFLRKKARKIIIKINYGQLNKTFTEKLNTLMEKNRDDVPYLIVIGRKDGYRTIVTPSEKERLKPSLSMKKELENLIGENSVEIIY
jgi:hypothetical protein